MSTKRYKPEQIVTLLRHIEVKLRTVGPLCKPAKGRSPYRPTTAGGRNTAA